MASARKTFAPTHASTADEQVDPVEFDVVFTRRKAQETHTFSAVPQMSYKGASGGIKLSRKRQDGTALLTFEALIRRSLLDDDGVPLDWEPKVDGGTFVGPDGDDRDTSELSKLLEQEAGSSLRRWSTLMDDDDELDIELEQIAGIYEYLVTEAAGRPTQRSSRS